MVSHEIADAVLERYLLWRQATVAVTLTYRIWTEGPAGERASAYAAYREALDEEESAAADYQACLRRADRLGPI
jgi:hypothetical protein